MSKIKLYKTTFSPLVMFAFFLMMTACANAPTISYAIVRESPVLYQSIQELSLKSDLIITGKVVAKKELINTARDPDDSKKEHSSIFNIGQIYEVEVINTLQGQAPKTIYIIQNQGSFSKNGNALKREDIDSYKKSSGVIPITIGRTYMMYLRSLPYSYANYPTDIIFAGTAHPWLFDLTNPDCVTVEDSIAELQNVFPPTSYQTIVTSIELAKESTSPSAEKGYPPPQENSSTCPASMEDGYPAPTP